MMESESRMLGNISLCFLFLLLRFAYCGNFRDNSALPELLIGVPLLTLPFA